MGYIRKHKDSIKCQAEVLGGLGSLAFAFALPFITIWVSAT